MAKPLFKNYSYEFDKNERKMLLNFCKQALKQIESDPKLTSEFRTFNSLTEKLNTAGTVKLTKDEKIKLVLQLKENIKFLQTKMKKGFFIKRWLFKSMYIQYSSLYEKHFEE
jgi:hypothetical protein